MAKHRMNFKAWTHGWVEHIFWNDECICGYFKYVGSCSAYMAEFWGVLEGLQEAGQRDFMNVFAPS